MADVHHATVYFTGHVQGVGFRYAALQVAREYDVAGQVTNLSDGRVLIEVEGRASDVSEFIAAVEDRMHGYVRKVERTGCIARAKFSGFTMK